MVSIIGHPHRKGLFRKSFASYRIAWSRRKLTRFLRLGFLGLFVITVSVSCEWGQPVDQVKEKRGVTVAEETASPADFGTYNALIIGINEYSEWPRLKFAERDANDIREILISRYGFASNRVTYLSGTNATRSNILSELRRKLESLGEEDNLLIFYAGHGQLDPLTETGYWIPVEGSLYDESGWIAFSNIQTLLTARGVKAKSVIVLTDSCYGGALARSGPTPGHRGPADEDYKQYEQRLTKLAKRRSRQIIASGGYEQVPDRSVFADLLKRALKENTYPMVDMEYLFFDKVYPELRFIGQQEPALARLVSGPEEDGQFVLLQQQEQVVAVVDESRKDKIPPEPTKPEETPLQPVELVQLTVRSNVHGDTVYIDGEARGSTRLDLKLAPGRHTVRVEKEDYHPHEEQVELVPGKPVIVRAQLQPKVVAAALISSFQANPSRVTSGQSSTLSWRTENAAAVEIAGIGRVPLSGTLTIEPRQSTSYTLVATNEQGRKTQKEIRIVVAAKAPRVISFLASPFTISPGASSTLSWQTENAQSVQISGIGRVELSGSIRVSPSGTSTYTLIAENEQGVSIDKALTVAVSARPPRILSFRAERQTIEKGESLSLRWQVSDATEVTINGEKVQSSGTMAVKPQRSSRYILTARNNEGEKVTDALTIEVVIPVPKIVRFDATSPVTQGGTTTLTWDTDNTEEVEISGVGRVPLSGTRVLKPDRTTTYTLIAKNEKGVRIKQQATVKVIPPTTTPPSVVLQPTVKLPLQLALRLPAPVQSSPAHGSVFNHYPRRTVLAWQPVAGAKSYTVEIEYKSGNQWQALRKQSGVRTSYTFDFVGAQPGRWRVSAVDAAGKTGTASGWREFRYTR